MNKNYLKRFELRVIGEEAILGLLKHLVTHRDTNIADFWMSQDKYTLENQDHVIICSKQTGFYIENEAFSYDFTDINQLCQSLLLDEIEV